MRTREQLINLRIIHVVIMLATALFIYQFSQWDDGLWIPITVLAIIGPFSPGLTINKSRQRVVGSIAGLLLSVVLWFFIHFNYTLLVPITVILVYWVAYSLLQNYTYFIMIVSILLCINFDYMNLFFNNEIIYLINRSLCVLIGVMICQFYEVFIFRRYYNNAINLVEKEKYDAQIIDCWYKLQSITNNMELETRLTIINTNISTLVISLNELNGLRETCSFSYSNQLATLAIIELYLEKINAMYHFMTKVAYDLLQNKITNQVLDSDEIDVPLSNIIIEYAD